jgi:ubiquinone/menaquinone biosynthesis C-methylase UbiE
VGRAAHGAVRRAGGLAGLLALLDDDLVMGDLGCGTGAVAAELAPFAGRVIAVDESKAMLAAARAVWRIA